MVAVAGTKAKAVAWLLLSPVSVLMALISTVESEALYYAQVSVFGVWATLGMASGIGALLRARWAAPLQRGLGLVAVVYFFIADTGILAFLVSALLNGGVADPAQGWGLTGLLLLLASAFVVRARAKRKRSFHASSDA